MKKIVACCILLCSTSSMLCSLGYDDKNQIRVTCYNRGTFSPLVELFFSRTDHIKNKIKIGCVLEATDGKLTRVHIYPKNIPTIKFFVQKTGFNPYYASPNHEIICDEKKIPDSRKNPLKKALKSYASEKNKYPQSYLYSRKKDGSFRFEISWKKVKNNQYQIKNIN